jgi:hypothetical protein
VKTTSAHDFPDACVACGFRVGHADDCHFLEDVCDLCHRPIPAGARRYSRDDGTPVCGDCIGGYVRCPHGYMQRGVCRDCRVKGGLS